MKDIFKSYNNYVTEIKMYSGRMGTSMKKCRTSSAPYADGRNKMKKNKSKK